MLETFFNGIFGWIIVTSPLGGLFFVSFIINLFVTLVYKFATDQDIMKGMRGELKKVRDEIKGLKDPDKILNTRKKAMELNMNYMTKSMKPMLISFVPIIFIFNWLRNTYDGIALSLFGINSWLIIYILSTIVFSLVLRKLLKVY